MESILCRSHIYSIFEFTVNDPDNEFADITYSAKIGENFLPTPVISISDSGANTISLDFSEMQLAGFQDVTILANAIEEVIVTATKRETNLMETPIAVSVVSQEQLNTQGIARISDLL